MINNIDEIIKSNEVKKQKYIDAINNYKMIYTLISNYYPQEKKYSEIIFNPDARVRFLLDSVNLTSNSDIMDDNTKDLILNMIQKIFNYLLDGENLEPIEVPLDIKNNLFDTTHLVNESELRFVFKLIQANKNIFDKEFRKKNFSQIINEGLHTGIIESLKIEEQNLSHLLGLTNFGSLYEFYRKSFVNKSIMKIVLSLDTKIPYEKNIDIEKFKIEFKKVYGIDYTHENYIKLINWKFDPGNTEESDKSITDEERESLNLTYDIIGKANTLNFYSDSSNFDELIEENNMVNTFVYNYIRNHILEIKSNKKGLNDLKSIYNENELEIILNDSKSIDESLLMKYVKESKYNFSEEKEFKDSFLKKFGYQYPLVNYNELVKKSIEFYNFSLFNNLNSIIVDYDGHQKKIRSSVFLVSYDSKEREKNSIKTKDLINKKDKRYYDAAYKENAIDTGLDHSYIDSLKSILQFPAKERYYYKYGFLSRDKRNVDDEIIKLNTSKNDSFTLIGFVDSDEEKERLLDLENGPIESFVHDMRCETNISSDYYTYMTDFTRYGREYPVDMIMEGEAAGDYQLTKILKMSSPTDLVNYYAAAFNELQYKYDYNKVKEYENIIIDTINKKLNEITEIKETSYLILEHQITKSHTKDHNKDNYKNELSNLRKEIKELKKLRNDLKEYFEEYKSYFNDDNNLENKDDNEPRKKL